MLQRTEQRRQQRDGGQHGHEHDEPGGVAHRGEVGDATELQSGQRDLNKIMAYLRAAPGAKVFAGADVLALALARIGGHGIVSGPSMMMPELSRSLVHQEGLDLIRAWIAAMPERR